MSNLSISSSAVICYKTEPENKKILPNLYNEMPADILRQGGESLNPIYANMMYALYHPVGYSERIISYCVLGGTSLGALLECKWVDVQSFSLRILDRIKNTFPDWYTKIQILTSHLKNPSPFTRLHLALTRLFRETFLQNFPETVHNRTAVILMRIADKPGLSSIPRSQDVKKLLQKNARSQNPFFPISSIFNRNISLDAFVSFIDIKNISLPTIYGSKEDKDLDAQKYVLTCIKKRRLVSQSLDGVTVFHLGAAKGDLPVVKAVLKQEIDINLPTTEENDVWPKDSTPLHCTAQILKSDSVAMELLEKMFLFLLERGADIDALNDQGETPLHLLFSFSHLTADFAEKILAVRPLMTLKSNVDQTTPLHRLLQNNSHIDPMPWLELYVAQQGDKNARFENGDTFLHCLVKRSDLTPEMIRDFHRIFDDELATKVNKTGNTPETILKTYNYNKNNLDTYRRYFKYNQAKKKQKTEK